MFQQLKDAFIAKRIAEENFVNQYRHALVVEDKREPFDYTETGCLEIAGDITKNILGWKAFLAELIK